MNTRAGIAVVILVLAVLAVVLGLVALNTSGITVASPPFALATATPTAVPPKPTATATAVATATLAATATVPPTAETSLPGISPTVSPTDSAPAIKLSEKDVPVYPGAKRVDDAFYDDGNVIRLVYLSSDDYEKIAGSARKSFEDYGWSDFNTIESVGSSVLLARKGKYTMLGTIIGPKAQSNPNFDLLLKQIKPAPNETVISLVITAG